MGNDESNPSGSPFPVLPGIPGLDSQVAPKRDASQTMQRGAEGADRLVGHGGRDPAYIQRMEEFAGLSHQEIYEKAQTMQPGVMHSSAQAWKKIGDAILANMMGLNGKLRTSIAQGWEGASADAVQAATQRFLNELGDIQDVVQGVYQRIEASAFGAEVVKARIPPVPPSAPIPALAGAENPAQAVAQQAIEREAHQTAIWAMRNYYVPTYEPAGQGVPTFVAPSSPADGPGLPVSNGLGSTAGFSNSNQQVGSGSSEPTAPGGPDTQEQPGTETAGVSPAATATDSTGSQGTSPQTTGTPASTTPAGVGPGNTTPTGAPGSAPGQPSSRIPSLPGPSTSASPGAPGRSAPSPGAVSAQGNPAAPGVVGRPAAAGMPGTPGMMPPGARGKSDDENEHKGRPEFLVHERNKIDLIGERAPTVPPVLGADPGPPRGDWGDARDEPRADQGDRSR
ncbi:hypothetical protein [Nocardia asiatica]|uniref:hypothetical protein n=1 Tax=Nocardia asiatica TaxID=209252 RepID=UPI002454F961|nr:hypothetical protein [Nocardia asiatica]